MKTLVLNIHGMICPDSVERVRQCLQTTRGVERIKMDTLTRTTFVEHDEHVCHLEDLLETLSAAGYQAEGHYVNHPQALEQYAFREW